MRRNFARFVPCAFRALSCIVSRLAALSHGLMSLRSVFKQMGRVDGSLYLGSRVLERFSGGRLRIVKYRLVAQPIGRAAGPALRADPATVMQDIPQGAALAAAFPRPPEIIARRYEAGATCTAALVRGEFAGFIWLQRGRYEEDEVRCSFVLETPAICVWDFDVYVEPRYRIGRTMARLWGHVDAEQAARGVRWSFSRISAFNPASLASHARLGIVDCGSALFFVAGPLQLSVLPRFPYLHLSAGDSSAPVWRLRPPA
jgi:GNAT superfamily N-acetyltransferase